MNSTAKRLDSGKVIRARTYAECWQFSNVILEYEGATPRDQSAEEESEQHSDSRSRGRTINQLRIPQEGKSEPKLETRGLD